jgi:hypothetical protein
MLIFLVGAPMAGRKPPSHDLAMRTSTAADLAAMARWRYWAGLLPISRFDDLKLQQQGAAVGQKKSVDMGLIVLAAVVYFRFAHFW